MRSRLVTASYGTIRCRKSVNDALSVRTIASVRLPRTKARPHRQKPRLT